MVSKMLTDSIWVNVTVDVVSFPVIWSHWSRSMTQISRPNYCVIVINWKVYQTVVQMEELVFQAVGLPVEPVKLLQGLCQLLADKVFRVNLYLHLSSINRFLSLFDILFLVIE